MQSEVAARKVCVLLVHVGRGASTTYLSMRFDTTREYEERKPDSSCKGGVMSTTRT